MISAAADSSFLVFLIRPAGFVFGVVGVAADQRHHRDAGLESRQPERELGKQNDAPSPPSSPELPCCANSDARHVAQHLRMPPDLARGRRPGRRVLSAR